MAAQNINLWDGNDYAIRVTERLGPMQSNTLEEALRALRS